MNRRDGGRGDGMGGGIQMIPGGRGLGGGVWLAVQGLPRDWREMDIFRAMEKRYGKVNEVRRSSANEREAMVQFVSDNDARFVWHLREMELYDRTVTVDLAPKGRGGGGGRDPSPPPMRSGGGGFRMGGGGGGGMGMQGGSMRRQFSNDRQRDSWNEPRGNFVSSNSGGSSFGNGQSGNGNAPVAPTPLPEDDEKATRTLFVGNLEYNVTESLLRNVFSKYGMVQDVDIKRPMQGNGVAYAFVRFLHLDFAYRAKCEMNGTRIGNYQCKIGYGKTNPTMRVWVGNLNYPGTATDLDENRLFDEFDRFGQIKKIDYVRGEHYGYITFASVSASQEACATMRGVTLKVNGDRGMKKIRLRVDYADPDDPYLPKMNKGESSKRRTDDSRNKDSDKSERRRQPSRSKSGSPPPKSRDNAKQTKRRRSSVEAESEPEDKSAQKRSRALSSSPPPKPSSKTAEERKTRDDKKSNDKPRDSKRRIPVTESVSEFRSKTDVVWKGSVVLKSTVYPIASHLLRGPIGWLNEVLSQGAELQITRRLRLEEEKLKDVTDKMNASESATLMCFDAPQKGTLQSGQHTKPLKHLQAYLLEKEAAGVINANQAIIYIFPTCAFANRIINEDMPTLSLPENGAPVRDEDLGILMIVSAPVDSNQPTGGAAE